MITKEIPLSDIFTNDFVDLTWDKAAVEADADAYDWQTIAAKYPAE